MNQTEQLIPQERKSLNWGRFLAVLNGATHEQKSRIESLEAEVAALKAG